MTLEEFETSLKAKYSETRIKKVALPRPSEWAYFRAPSQQEFDQYQSLAADGGPESQTAFKRYVSQCFVGAWPERTLADCIEQVGPGALSGPFGSAVNDLSGVRDRPTQEI